jgi:hypothetical protein
VRIVTNNKMDGEVVSLMGTIMYVLISPRMGSRAEMPPASVVGRTQLALGGHCGSSPHFDV